MNSTVSYAKTDSGWTEYTRRIVSELVEERQVRRVCDIGAGANPLLDDDFVRANALEYTILDISASELEKAPAGYRKIVADISSPGFSLDGQFQLIFSKMLAEHVRDGEQFHRNVMSLLAPGGLAVHVFPTLYTLPFLVNYLVPESLGSKLLGLFAPRDKYQHAKFPAYYRWCRGPTQTQMRRFKGLGYRVVEYRGFFGHAGYYNKIPILKSVHDLKSAYLLRHPHPLLTSYACVVLEKAG